MAYLVDLILADSVVRYILMVALGVALVSAAAWFAARRIGGLAALRHCVLFTGLICCLAMPLAVGLSTRCGLTVVWIKIPVTLRITVPIISPISNDLDAQAPSSGSATDHLLADSKQPGVGRSLVPKDLLGIDVSTTPTANHRIHPKNPVAPSSAFRSPARRQLPDALAPAKTRSGYQQFRTLAATGLFAWACGTLLLTVRLLYNSWRILALRRSAHREQNERLLAELRAAAERVGLSPAPLLLASRRRIVPMAVGIGRPAIVLPEGLMETLGPEGLQDVLVHESAHLKRGDHWIVFLEQLAAAVYWPVITVHLLRRELQRAREEVCDNEVLIAGDPIEYGRTLLRTAEWLIAAEGLGAGVGVLENLGELERRIAGLMDPRRTTATKAAPAAAWLTSMLFVAGTALLVTTRLAFSAPPAAPLQLPGASTTQAAPGEPDAARLAEHFRGRVTGPDGLPVPGARLYIVLTRSDRNDAGPVRDVTDAEGQFAFDALDMTYPGVDGLPLRRQGLLIADADGYAPDWIKVHGDDLTSSRWDPERDDEFHLQLAADDVAVHGRLIGPDGQPLKGAHVRLDELMIPEDRDLDAHLRRESSKHGVFLTTDYERVLHEPRLLPGVITQVQTDEQGEFTLRRLGRDRLVRLSVSAPTIVDSTMVVMTRNVPDIGVRPLNGRPTSIIHGARPYGQLEPGRTIRGRVVDRETGEPLAGMRVGLLESPYNDFSSESYPRVTDQEGSFVISGLSPSDDELTLVAVSASGLPYETTWVDVSDESEVVIRCARAIPFRLKLFDDAGDPVVAEVTSVDVQPSPYRPPVRDEVLWPVNRAARRSDGVYEGFVLPGPGAVLVKTPVGLYRPARVDPTLFFAPGRTNGTDQGSSLSYGDLDTLVTSSGRYQGTVYRGNVIDQQDYSAIILVNPDPDSGRLELSATLIRDSGRRVTLVDPQGQPVLGARMSFEGQSWQLRSASFSLKGLHPKRVRRITFLHEKLGLIGYLEADADGESPYTVRMQPWGTITGRLVGRNGEARPPGQLVDGRGERLYSWWLYGEWKEPPGLRVHRIEDGEPIDRRLVEMDTYGRFHVDRLIPGQAYRLEFALKTGLFWSESAGTVQEEVVVDAGQIRSLGDLRSNLTFRPQYRRPEADDGRSAAAIPVEAWGEPVGGLRVAMVLESPPIDAKGNLHYSLVAENVGDHDLRFGAAVHENLGLRQVHLVDEDGREAVREPGTLNRFVELRRFWLKPAERIALGSFTLQVVRLDAQGRPVESSDRNYFHDAYLAQPGRYRISATVTLGSRIECRDPETSSVTVLSPQEGEWTGQVRTGVVPLSLSRPGTL